MAAEKETFLNEYGKMQPMLEYRPEKGLLYRKTSPDNPLQLGAGRRLNKSFDQSTTQMADVDYVKNVFDRSEVGIGQRADLGRGQTGPTESKGMFIVKRPNSRQAAPAPQPKQDAQFIKNAGKFFE